MKISVIVPIYNVKEYLEECISSILRQTYTDYELILVDDGSTDGCGEECDKMLARDARIKVVHKENGGLSSARNAGMKVATGEFYFFIDSDDYITDDALRQFVSIQGQTNSDIVMALNTRDKNFLDDGGDKPYTIYTPQVALRKALRDKINVSAWAKLYKASLFEGIYYPEGKNYEDYATTPKLFKRANQIACMHSYLYFYRVNETSITGAQFSAKRMQYFDVAEDILQFIKVEFPELTNCAICRNTKYAISFYHQIAKSNFNDKQIEKFIVKYIRKNIVRYFFTSRYSFFSKIYGLCVAIFPRLAKKI